ncbi:MAG: hypothetical protein JWP37_3027 [Mucilaginibacter sp.]|nr:hypothetical protein [Mucilaginibacter sp.]
MATLKKLNKIITQFKEILKPRIVETGYSSFKVGLSSDTVNSVEGSAYKDWQRALILNYQNDVIDVDYSSETDIGLIAEKFPDTAIRKEIFEPIIDIINDKRYSTEVVNYKRTLKRKYNSISKDKKESLLPPPEPISQIEQYENKKFITLVIEVNESQDLTNLGKKTIQENTLFTQERDSADIDMIK